GPSTTTSCLSTTRRRRSLSRPIRERRFKAASSVSEIDKCEARPSARRMRDEDENRSIYEDRAHDYRRVPGVAVARRTPTLRAGACANIFGTDHSRSAVQDAHLG